MEITSELGRNREKIGEVHDKVSDREEEGVTAARTAESRGCLCVRRRHSPLLFEHFVFGHVRASGAPPLRYGSGRARTCPVVLFGPDNPE